MIMRLEKNITFPHKSKTNIGKRGLYRLKYQNRNAV